MPKPPRRLPTSAPDPDLAKLPKALRERAQQMAEAAAQRRADAAREAFGRAKAALGETHRHLYDLGTALAALKAPGAPESLGFADFADLCAKGLGLARTTVTRLLRAVASIPQERYAALGPDRVDALFELADATAADDTEAILAGESVTLWKKGPTLDVATSSTAAIREAARATRARRDVGAAKPRGRTVSPAERRLAKLATEALANADSGAKLVAKATVPGRAARFELVGLSEAEARRALRGLAIRLPKE